jgi:hypothetical protein
MTSTLLQKSKLIFGSIITPLAQLNKEDIPNRVPIVDCGENGPIKCQR